MSIGLIGAFKLIPWQDVIAAAPVVVAGAKKLWTLAKDRNAGKMATAQPLDSKDRLQQLETEVSELRRESAVSSELIKSLAEQNAQLVKAVEILRVRTRLLLVISLIVMLLLAIAIARL